MNKKKKILVLSPTLSGGSWLVEEKLLSRLDHSKVSVLIVALGQVYHPNKLYKYILIPYPHYDRWGVITEFHPLINLLWNLPLIILGCLLTVFYRPDVIIYNGLPTAMTVSNLSVLLKQRNILMYHTYIANFDKLTLSVLALFARNIAFGVVNSQGSKQDLSSIMKPEKIMINEHFADDIFFSGTIQTKKSKSLTLFYVGRLDEDKVCYPLIKVAEKLGNDQRFHFIFAGVGRFSGELKILAKKYRNITYLKYIKDRSVLKNSYQQADVLWSYADKTYLSMPAVEALACGTPIIIPNIQALGKDNNPSVRIETDLVPQKIGWLVDPNNQQMILKLLHSLCLKKIPYKMKLACRDYAKMKYSRKNQNQILIKINEFFAHT